MSTSSSLLVTVQLAAGEIVDGILLQLAHHTTGRPAAHLIENYGSGPVRPLATASLGFLHSPSERLADHPIVERRGTLTVGTPAVGG